MTAIDSYARALAVVSGVAQPIATVRHVHLSPRPMVVVPLALAGEAHAPLAAMLGTHPRDPAMLFVPQPRNRDLRFAFAASLADIVLPHIHQYCYDVEHVKGRDRFVGAPQVLVPNPAGIRFVALLGRSTRFRRTDGRFPVTRDVPLLGRWLTFLAEQAHSPGSALLLAMTDVLSAHWATGQSALEDANLAALMGWIDPPSGLDGAGAARLAEDPLVWPPAGPATDPGFDTTVLVPAVRAYSGAEPGSPVQRRAHTVLEDALRGQLEPTWDLMWRAVDRLRALPPGGSVAGRWATDRARFTNFREYVSGGGLPQGKRDGAVASARRLNRLERAQADLDAARAFDDPLVMAAHRTAGAAFAGTVSTVDRARRRPNENGSMVTRPLLTLTTADPVHLATGTQVVAVSRRNQTGVVTDVTHTPDGVLVTLELSGGMGRSRVPPPATVPEVGEELCYTSVLAVNVPIAPLPDVEATPWTHGGPPQAFQPTEGDAGEEWA